MSQLAHLIKTFTGAVTPAQAWAYTLPCRQNVAGCGAVSQALMRMGPGLRRGDDWVWGDFGVLS